MTRFQNPSDGITQEALAGLVAEAVQQALMQQGVMLDAEALASASKIAGHVAAALPSLPPAQRLTIGSYKGEWADLASDFLRVMTNRLARDGSAMSERSLEHSAPRSETAGPGVQPIAERAAELQAMLIEDWAGSVAGSTYLEEKLRIPRSTLHRWQRRGEVVALRKGGRKHVFPLAQFVDGRPVPGIGEVLSAIANPRLAWFWLSRPAPELDGRIPIEMLRDDMVEDVARAARGLS